MSPFSLFIQIIFCAQIYCSTGGRADDKHPNPTDSTTDKEDRRARIEYLIHPQEEDPILTNRTIPIGVTASEKNPRAQIDYLLHRPQKADSILTNRTIPIDVATSEKNPRARIDYLLHRSREEDSTPTYQAISNKDDLNKNTERSFSPGLGPEHRKEPLDKGEGLGVLPPKITLVQNRSTKSYPVRTNTTTVERGNERLLSLSARLSREELPSFPAGGQVDQTSTRLTTISPSLEALSSQKAISEKNNVATTVRMTFPRTWVMEESSLFAKARHYKETGGNAFLISAYQAAGSLDGSNGTDFIKLTKRGVTVFKSDGTEPPKNLYPPKRGNEKWFLEEHPLIPWIVDITKGKVIVAAPEQIDTMDFKLIKNGKISPLDLERNPPLEEKDIVLIHSKGLKGFDLILEGALTGQKGEPFELLKKEINSFKEKNYEPRLLVGLYQF